MDPATSDENQVKASPDRDNEKNRTLKACSIDASPSWVRYRLTCSIVLTPSDPVNLAKSGIL